MHKLQASLVLVAPRRRPNRNKSEEKFRLELEAEILVVAFRYRTSNGQQIYISVEQFPPKRPSNELKGLEFNWGELEPLGNC
jgi:hypothetical protein